MKTLSKDFKPGQGDVGYQYTRVFPRKIPIYLKSVKSLIPNTWICLQTEYHIPNFFIASKRHTKKKKKTE